MAISFIDLKWPQIASSQVEGRSRKESLKIPVILDLSSFMQGACRDVEFTLAPGSVAADVRQIACASVRATEAHVLKQQALACKSRLKFPCVRPFAWA